jgi:hypothetical protein
LHKSDFHRFDWLTTKIDRSHWRIANYANWKKESKNVTCCIKLS